MPVKPSEIRQLCTASELRLVNQSFKKPASAGTAAEIRRRIEQARKLRDKFSGLAKTQRRESRGKADPRGKRPSKGNQRTTRKAQLFDETLERFQTQLAQIDSSGDRKKTAKSAKRATARASERTKKKTAARKSSSRRETTSPSATASTAPAAKSRPAPKASPAPLGQISALVSLGGPTATKSSTSFAAGAQPALISRQQRRQAKAAAATGALNQRHFALSGSRKIQTHTAASVRRAQARRDSKG